MPQCGCTEVFMKAAVNQTFDNTAHFLSWTMFLLSVKLQTDTKLLCWSLFEELRGADVSSDLQDKDFKLQWFIRDQLSVESQNRKSEEIQLKGIVYVVFVPLWWRRCLISFNKNSFIFNPCVSDCRSDEPERSLSALSAPRSDSAAENLQQHHQLSRPEQTSSESEVKRSVSFPPVGICCFYCLYINCLLLIKERVKAQGSILGYQVINISCWTGNSDAHTDLWIRTSYLLTSIL